MIVLGIRTSVKSIRYALIEKQGCDYKFNNLETENRIVFPKSILLIEQKLHWFKQEFDRIVDQNKEIAKIALKTSEYSRTGETKQSRDSAYLDSIVLLVAAQNGIAIERCIYTQLKTNSKQVKESAESFVSPSSKYWDSQIADAVVAAVFGANK